MIYLVGTNILLRLVDRTHPLNSTIRSAIRSLQSQGHQLKTTAQNCIEFWNVATRPIERNGFGLTPIAVDRLLRLIERLFPVLPDVPAIYEEWRRLVVVFGVSRVQVHDARLVAAMKLDSITHILTFNTADFARYVNDGIVAVNASDVTVEQPIQGYWCSIAVNFTPTFAANPSVSVKLKRKIHAEHSEER